MVVPVRRLQALRCTKRDTINGVRLRCTKDRGHGGNFHYYVTKWKVAAG